MKKGLIIVCTLIAFAGHATRYYGNSAATLIDTVPQPGDTVIALNGTWLNQAINIDEWEGTAAAPIVLMAQTPGWVVITGASSMSVTGSSYVTIKWLYFKECVLNLILLNLLSGNTNIRVTDCYFRNNNNPVLNPAGTYKYINVDCPNVRIDHCGWDSMFVKGPVIQIQERAYIYTTIDSCYMGRRDVAPKSFGNGSEQVRIGAEPKSSNLPCFVTVSHNYLNETDGEFEAITMKMSDVTIEYNTVRNTIGVFNFRYGNRCRVAYNYFLASIDSAASGVNGYGQDNYIVSNYFENQNGDDRKPVFGLPLGSVAPNCGYSENPQQQRMHFDSNVIANNGKAFVYGYVASIDQNIKTLSINNNANIVVSSVNDTLPIIRNGNVPFIWKGFNNIFYGTAVNHFPFGWTNTNPALVTDAYGIKRLPAGSSLLTTLVGSNTKAMASPTNTLPRPWTNADLYQTNGVGTTWQPY